MAEFLTEARRHPARRGEGREGGGGFDGAEATAILERARAAVDPALRGAVDSLPGSLRRIALYHFGWEHADGSPAAGSAGKAIRPALVLAAAAALGCAPRLTAAEKKPNVVFILADDLGWTDLGCQGSRYYETPNIDRMAAEGMRFTYFYAAQAVCSASRAALLTGCYPVRVGILGALGPKSKVGINADETTLAELLKTRGYATAIYGKWHLGDRPQFLPTRNGFDD